jgi:hypothetical protein
MGALLASQALLAFAASTHCSTCYTSTHCSRACSGDGEVVNLWQYTRMYGLPPIQPLDTNFSAAHKLVRTHKAPDLVSPTNIPVHPMQPSCTRTCDARHINFAAEVHSCCYRGTTTDRPRGQTLNPRLERLCRPTPRLDFSRCQNVPANLEKQDMPGDAAAPSALNAARAP